MDYVPTAVKELRMRHPPTSPASDMPKPSDGQGVLMRLDAEEWALLFRALEELKNSFNTRGMAQEDKVSALLAKVRSLAP
jgi:hypothetical protein